MRQTSKLREGYNQSRCPCRCGSGELPVGAWFVACRHTWLVVLGEDLTDEFSAAAHADLAEDGLEVIPHSVWRDVQLPGDFGSREPAQYELRYLVLALRACALGSALGAGQTLDHFPRSRVCEKKRRRDRLIGLAEARPEWVVGFLDETWWSSRLARPALNSWSDAGEPLRLIEQSVAKDDPDPKAISCYGLYVPEFEEVWLRFVDGRPVSGITTRFLLWCSKKLLTAGKQVWVLIWDNASWHISKEVIRNPVVYF